jgi:hypothetical protein
MINTNVRAKKCTRSSNVFHPTASVPDGKYVPEMTGIHFRRECLSNPDENAVNCH